MLGPHRRMYSVKHSGSGRKLVCVCSGGSRTMINTWKQKRTRHHKVILWISMVLSWADPGASHAISLHSSDKKKKNRTKGEIPVARQEFTRWPSLCTRSEGSWHSQPHRLWCPISSRLFLTLQSIRPDADPHPELPRLAVSPDWPSWWDNDSAVCLALRIGLQGKSWKDLLPNITTICLTWTLAACWGVNGFYLVTLIIRTVWSLVASEDTLRFSSPPLWYKKALGLGMNSEEWGVLNQKHFISC